MLVRNQKWLLILSALLLIAIFISGCGKETVQKEDGKLLVYTSFYPMYDLTQKIAGDKVTIVNMVPVGIEPHEWEPKTRDVAALGDADMFVYNGLNMEHWLDDVKGAVPEGKVVFVEASAGLSMNDKDPHIWLSPPLALKEMEKIKDALCQLDPKNKDYYENNFLDNQKKIEELDKAYRDGLSNCKSRNLVTAHEAFGYLCDEYGLKQIAVQGLSAEVEPNMQHMRDIIDFIKENKVSVIFGEELISPKLLEEIQQETGCRMECLSTLEGLSEEEEKAGKEYFSLMYDNLEKIKAALQ